MSDRPLVLITEDDDSARAFLDVTLRRAGMSTVLAANGREALDHLQRLPVDVVLLDMHMPVLDGLSTLREIRASERLRTLPVILVTGSVEEADRIGGLDSGADDYLTKPFSARELLARIQAVLRRSAPAGEADRVEVEGLTLDLAGHRVAAEGKTVPLGPTEYRLLAFLMTHPDRVYSRSQLLDRVWGGNVYVEERTVDVHIRRLRKSLELSGYDRFVQTVRGAGYRFSAQQD
jgi:two-component system phosphate regulon response regulator PhoB